MIDFIIFQGKRYKIRQIVDKKLGSLIIASVNLQNKLLNEGKYVSDEAQLIDNQIFFFIEPNQFKISDIKLISYLNCVCK